MHHLWAEQQMTVSGKLFYYLGMAIRIHVLPLKAMVEVAP